MHNIKYLTRFAFTLILANSDNHNHSQGSPKSGCNLILHFFRSSPSSWHQHHYQRYHVNHHDDKVVMPSTMMLKLSCYPPWRQSYHVNHDDGNHLYPAWSLVAISSSTSLLTPPPTSKSWPTQKISEKTGCEKGVVEPHLWSIAKEKVLRSKFKEHAHCIT